MINVYKWVFYWTCNEMLWFRMFLLCAAILLFYSILLVRPVELKLGVFDLTHCCKKTSKMHWPNLEMASKAPLNTTQSQPHVRTHTGMVVNKTKHHLSTVNILQAHRLIPNQSIHVLGSIQTSSWSDFNRVHWTEAAAASKIYKEEKRSTSRHVESLSCKSAAHAHTRRCLWEKGKAAKRFRHNKKMGHSAEWNVLF